MEDSNRIIDKIRKLLALANSSNEHEAALAASHAQRLLSAHNLAMADIQSEHKPQSADKVEATVSKTLPKWVRHLSAGVCTAFDCQGIHHPATGKLTFIGVGADVQIAAYTFTYLDKTVRKLCSHYMKHHANENIPTRQLPGSGNDYHFKIAGAEGSNPHYSRSSCAYQGRSDQKGYE